VNIIIERLKQSKSGYLTRTSQVNTKSTLPTEKNKREKTSKPKETKRPPTTPRLTTKVVI
jgi:hypothetical protein